MERYKLRMAAGKVQFQHKYNHNIIVKYLHVRSLSWTVSVRWKLLRLYPVTTQLFLLDRPS